MGNTAAEPTLGIPLLRRGTEDLHRLLAHLYRAVGLQKSRGCVGKRCTAVVNARVLTGWSFRAEGLGP